MVEEMCMRACDRLCVFGWVGQWVRVHERRCVPDFMKIRPVGAGQTEGQTDGHDKAKSAFRNFANAPEN